jgi:hypothetical protein
MYSIFGNAKVHFLEFLVRIRSSDTGSINKSGTALVLVLITPLELGNEPDDFFQR